jgi:hypothetical protein
MMRKRATRYLPPATSDHEVFWWVEDYLGKLSVPFKAIRVYRGLDIILDENRSSLILLSAARVDVTP